MLWNSARSCFWPDLSVQEWLVATPNEATFCPVVVVRTSGSLVRLPMIVARLRFMVVDVNEVSLSSLEYLVREDLVELLVELFHRHGSGGDGGRLLHGGGLARAVAVLVGADLGDLGERRDLREVRALRR